MDLCGGALLIHDDGTVAACTEELAGRCCPGPFSDHVGGSTSCTAALGEGGCELCGGGWFAPLEWRHALRIAARARNPRRCRSHILPRGRSAVPVNVSLADQN